MSKAPSTRLESFLTWMKDQGITWNEDAIKFVSDAPRCSGLSLGIFAKRDITEGEELALIPKSACISIRTSTIADIIEKEELGGGLALVVAVQNELTQGPASPWHGYFQALPTREYVSMFWNKSEEALLKGTNLQDTPLKDRLEVAEDFNQHVLPMADTYSDRLNKELWTEEQFKIAASFVASRAFGVDEYHGDAMVPLADVFNHKVSVVALSDDYEVFDGEARDSSSSSEDEECEDHDHHKPADTNKKSIMKQGKQHGLYNISAANGLHLHLEIAIVEQGDDLQIVAASNVPANNEVHNTYGELGNAELVKKYGFALRQNPFTAVTLDKQSLIDAMEQVAHLGGDDDKSNASKPATAAETITKKRRMVVKLLSDESELLDDDEEPFELLPNGHIGPSLYATLRVLRLIVEDDLAGSGNKQKKKKKQKVSLEQAIALNNDDDEEDRDWSEAVQIWPVRNTDGTALDQDSVVKSTAIHPGITASMMSALQIAVQKRLSLYPFNLATDLKQLEEMDSKGTRLSEHESAVRAALLLRITEQEILEDALIAIDRHHRHSELQVS